MIVSQVRGFNGVDERNKRASLEVFVRLLDSSEAGVNAVIAIRGC